MTGPKSRIGVFITGRRGRFGQRDMRENVTEAKIGAVLPSAEGSPGFFPDVGRKRGPAGILILDF